MFKLITTVLKCPPGLLKDICLHIKPPHITIYFCSTFFFFIVFNTFASGYLASNLAIIISSLKILLIYLES